MEWCFDSLALYHPWEDFMLVHLVQERHCGVVQCLLECFQKLNLFWSCRDRVPTNQLHKSSRASGQAEYLRPVVDTILMLLELQAGVYVFVGWVLGSWHDTSSLCVSSLCLLDLHRIVVLNRHGVGVVILVLCIILGKT
jgi:hypothetical protein